MLFLFRRMKFRTITISSVFAIVLLAFACQASAQKKEIIPVDFNRVKSVTSNPESRYYFPKLLHSYISFNYNKFELEDMRNLYYGYMFQEDYNPYRQSVYADKVEEYIYKKDLTRDECDSLEHYANLSLQDNMFDFEQLEYFAYALKAKKKHARYEVFRKNIHLLLSAIMTSGDGTKEHPWVVICPMHEYDIVNFLGFKAVDHEEISEGIDYVKVEKKEGSKTEGFYFDVKRMLEIGRQKGYDE